MDLLQLVDVEEENAWNYCLFWGFEVDSSLYLKKTHFEFDNVSLKSKFKELINLESCENQLLNLIPCDFLKQPHQLRARFESLL